VYKIKRSATKKEASEIGTVVTTESLPREPTTKTSTSDCDDEDYIFPCNYVPPRGQMEYENCQVIPMQPNPSYRGIQLDEKTRTLYENFK